jgi:hypothetical protein
MTDHSTPPRAQEDYRLPNFLRLADALHPIRPSVGRLDAWPARLGTALSLIIEGFDGVAGRWGWSRLAVPEPERSGFVRERDQAFRDRYERPVLEATLAWRESDPRGCPVWAQELADAGQAAGFGPTGSNGEDPEQRLRRAVRDRDGALRLGVRIPVLKRIDGMPNDQTPDAEAHRSLERGYGLLTSVWSEFAKAAAPEAPPEPGIDPAAVDPHPISPEQAAHHRREIAERRASVERLRARHRDCTDPAKSGDILDKIGSHEQSIAQHLLRLRASGLDPDAAPDRPPTSDGGAGQSDGRERPLAAAPDRPPTSAPGAEAPAALGTEAPAVVAADPTRPEAKADEQPWPEAAAVAPDARSDRGPSAAEIMVLLKLGRHHAAAARRCFNHMVRPAKDEPDGAMQAGIAAVEFRDRFYPAWKDAGGQCPYGWPDDIQAVLRSLGDADWHISRFRVSGEFDPVRALVALVALDARLDRLAAAVAGVDAPGNMAPAAPGARLRSTGAATGRPTAPGAEAPDIVPTGPARPGPAPERLTPGSRAIGAALDLKKAGEPVTLKAACARAGVDRGHVRNRYPDAVKTIRALGSPDRRPRRGVRDRRTGEIGGVDDPED